MTLDSDTLYPHILAVFREWHTASLSIYAPFENWLLMRQWQQSSGQNNKNALPKTVQHGILAELESLALQLPTETQVIIERYFQKKTTRELSHEMFISVDSLNRLQSKGLHRLAEVLAHKETTLREAKSAQLEKHLPPSPYAQFIGQTNLLSRVVESVRDVDAPFVIALCGLGGIGKTALADAAARVVIQRFQFDKIYWVRLEATSMSNSHLAAEALWRQVCQGLSRSLNPELEKLPLHQQEVVLQQEIKEKPTLVVIDNLEEPGDVHYLIGQLSRWNNPSRFLLTTRYKPIAESGVLTYTVDELDWVDTLALLRHEAQQRGVTDLIEAEDEQLQPIFQMTGGNPLAIKLVVGLATSMPLSAVLKDFINAHPGPTAEMYHHIYLKAWQALSAEARSLLEVMPQIAESGAQPEQMQAITEMEDALFWRSVNELVSRSLLEVRGTVWDRRYGIHRLTESFLHTEIIHWLGNPNDDQPKL